MNPLFSYAVKSLRKNRTRTIVTILGIMMSAGLMVALATLGTSLYRYVQEGYISRGGDWHIGIDNGKKQDVEAVCMEDGVVNPFRAMSIGYARVETENPDKPYLYLEGVEPEYYEHMPFSLTEGHIPEKTGEILLPESFRRAAGDGWQVGDIITLDVGLRMKDGQALWQQVPYGRDAEGGFIGAVKEETLQQTQQRKFIVAGFYEDSEQGNSAIRYDAPGQEAYVWWDGAGTEDGYDRFSLWFQISRIGNKEYHALYDKLRLVYGYNGVRLPVNAGLLSLYGIRTSDSKESAAAAVMVAILLLIILAGSVMLIYNAFAISVGERTKQFGLLSSIGATRKQIRKSVLYEAAIVSGIGTLLGVGVGMVLVIGILGAAGETVAELMEFSFRPKLYVWFPAVLLAMIFVVLTVLVSAWIPAGRATKVTAIEAIRQNREIRYSGRHRKTSRWIERLFGFEGSLAVTYSRRNRSRYRVTTFALFLSMVLFISINAFAGYMMTVVQTEYKTSNYDVLVQVPWISEQTREERQEILEALRRIEGVESVTQNIFMTYSMPFLENEDHVSADFRKVLEDTPERGSASISVVDDRSFSDFCREHGLEEARFRNTEDPTVIVSNHFKSSDAENGNTKLIEGLLEEDGRFYLDLASPFYYREDYRPVLAEFQVGYYAESLAPGSNNSWSLSIMLPEAMAKSLGLQNTVGNACSYCLVAKNHRQVAEEAEMLMEAYPGGTVYDQAQRQAKNRNLVFMLRFLANGFIIMITLTSVANVFSTISSSLKLRQKEFAMLKTVGMTQQGLRRMMNLECLMYGGKAVLLGLPVSVLAAAVMYHYFRKDVIFDFYLPVQSILAAIGSIFGVVFATMLYAMGRMKKGNVIDVLKQESF